MTGFKNELTEMTLSEFQRICVAEGIDMVEYGPLATEMYWDGFCVAEVKQAKRNLSSDFIRLIKKERIHPFRISKYCMATAKLYPQLKINNFKRKFLHLDKVLQDAYSAQENIST